MKIMPVLVVADLDRSLDFYQKVIGFTTLWREPMEGGGENCMIGLDEIRLLLTTGTHLGNPPRFTGTLYIDMQGIEDYYARVKDRVQLVWPLEAMDYEQKEFGLSDPDGYMLAFAESTGKT